MADDTAAPIRCLIVPSDPGFLVIPSAAVAEIVPLSIDEEQADGNLVGVMAWRGIQVPVYSIEGLAGMSIPTFGKRSKAFVFYPWKGAAKDTFFAIAVLHDPRPRLLTGEDIQQGEDLFTGNKFISASFQFDGESALIPDLQAISQQ